jgi:hypothetical protein
MTQRLYLAQRINIALQLGNAKMLLLCGNHHAANQANHNELGPIVDMRNVERRGLMSA